MSRAQPHEHSRTGLSADALHRAIADHLAYSIARPPSVLTPEHYYRALALAVRDRMQQRWMANPGSAARGPAKVTCYLSAEFLMGPQLGNNLLNLRIERQAREARRTRAEDLDAILECEEEPGLGNGGLGRLAACYLDSMATLQRPSIGYGIRYEFGIFDQEIQDGW
ncbi:glycogen/starch/alpha-glucan phosphorylase, partial [Mycolicibacterium gadium]|uniref:glycogen/starch/alpha-glucan phosphorylase n=1 Tax=Mycolicibacterium gadium TaxID=1794 RepID=UPI0021F2D0EE